MKRLKISIKRIMKNRKTKDRQYNGRQTMIYKTLHRLQTIQWQTNNDLQNTTQITDNTMAERTNNDLQNTTQITDNTLADKQ